MEYSVYVHVCVRSARVDNNTNTKRIVNRYECKVLFTQQQQDRLIT